MGNCIRRQPERPFASDLIKDVLGRKDVTVDVEYVADQDGECVTLRFEINGKQLAHYI